jgi:autotransporter-associated beta strand protein
MMFCTHWRGWFSRKARPFTKSRQARCGKPSYQLRIEALEERITPASLVEWIRPAALGPGNWSNGTNWSAGAAPTSTDIAVFDLANTADSIVDQNVSVAGFLIGGVYANTVDLSGFTLTVGANDFMQKNAVFAVDGGTLTVGNLTITGTGVFQDTGTVNVAGDFTNSAGSGGFVAGSGDTVFFTASGGKQHLTSGGATFLNVADDGGATLALQDPLTVSGNLTAMQNNIVDLNGQNLSAGSITGPGEITNSSTTAATLTVTNTGHDSFNGTLTGNLTLEEHGTASTLTLTQANTYTGGTVVSAGTLAINTDAKLGDVHGLVTISDGTLEITGATDTTRSFTLAGNHSNSIRVDDAITYTIRGPVGGTGVAGLTKTGNGTLVLANTPGNSYTGGTAVSAGTLVVDTDAELGNAGGVIITDATLEITGNTATSRIFTLAGNTANIIQVDDGTGYTINGMVGGTGAAGLTKIGNGQLRLINAGNTYLNGTQIDAGILQINDDAELGDSTGGVTISNATLKVNGNTSETRSFTLSGNTANTIQVDGSFAYTINGAVGGLGTGGLTKTGNGSLTLANTGNSYAGGTDLTAGTLVVTGAAPGVVVLQPGTTLRGTGTITRDIDATAGGTVQPGVGSDTGILTAATIHFSGNSTFKVDLNGTTAGPGPGGYSQIDVTATGCSFNGSNLVLTPAATLPTTGAFTLIRGPVTPTDSFAGFPTGRLVTVSGKRFLVQNTGDTGNSTTSGLTVTLVSVTPTPVTVSAVEGNRVDSNMPVAQFTAATIPAPGTTFSAASYTATIHWTATDSTTGTVHQVSPGVFQVLAGTPSFGYPEETSLPLNISVDVYYATDANSTSPLTTVASQVNVADSNIHAGAVTFNATEGAGFTGQVATFADDNAFNTDINDFSATITWGDGQQSAGTITKTSPGHFSVTGTHTYGEELTNNVTYPISYPVSVTITDVGGSHDTAASTGLVADAALTVTETRVVSPNSQTVTNQLIGTFTDAGGPDPVGNYQVVIKWGDNTSTTKMFGVSSTTDANGTVTVEQQGSGFRILGTHTYTTFGTFPICVQVFDEGSSNTGYTPPVITVGNVTGPKASVAFIGTTSQNFTAQLLFELTGSRQVPVDLNGSQAFKGALAGTTDVQRLIQLQPFLVQQAQSSAASLVNKVRGLYQTFLLRDADVNGLNSFVHFLAQNGSFEQAQAVMMGSDEYFSIAFRKIQQGDPTGLLLNDNEVGRDMYWTEVVNFYHDGLGRSYASIAHNFPDFIRQAKGWYNELKMGLSRSFVALQILSSVEGRNKAVKDLYLSVLGRYADPKGQAAAAAFLLAGHTEKEVEAFLFLSAEFLNDLVSGTDVPCPG